MAELVVTTYDWVPKLPRGYVRDLRICWALEEAGLPYRMATTPFATREPEHLAHQPFAQVPWLIDGEISIFESGAILLHLGHRSSRLLPDDPSRRNAAIAWLFAALNSLEMASVPWSLFHFSGDAGETAAWTRTDAFLQSRLQRLEAVLATGQWLAGSFSVADILMADALRLVDRFQGLAAYPACRDYVGWAVSRPAFVKAHADQIARYEAADRTRI